jgi:predicted nucleotidyltransferase
MREEVQQIKNKIVSILRQHGVLRAGLFGSLVRGNFREDSDICPTRRIEIACLVKFPNHDNMSVRVIMMAHPYDTTFAWAFVKGEAHRV